VSTEMEGEAPNLEPDKILRPIGPPPTVDTDDPEYQDIDYQDYDPDTTFVIAGALYGFRPRKGEWNRAGMRDVQTARAWALKKYGKLYEGGKNLELEGSGRWAFRVPRPKKGH
jgi:hypothetical protein